MPHDFEVNVQKRLGNRRHAGDSGYRLCGSTIGIQRNVQHRGGHERAPCTRPRAPWGREVSGAWRTHRCSPPLPWTQRGSGCLRCVFRCCSSVRRRGTSGLRSKTIHYRREIQDLRVQGIVRRPLVWTAEERPHPYADDPPACRNGQQTSATALLWRMAAMTQAVLPNTSAQWAHGLNHH